jgi:hypothetical protein
LLFAHAWPWLVAVPQQADVYYTTNVCWQQSHAIELAIYVRDLLGIMQDHSHACIVFVVLMNFHMQPSQCMMWVDCHGNKAGGEVSLMHLQHLWVGVCQAFVIVSQLLSFIHTQAVTCW